jgi:hypothetical protein
MWIERRPRAAQGAITTAAEAAGAAGAMDFSSYPHAFAPAFAHGSRAYLMIPT